MSLLNLSTFNNFENTTRHSKPIMNSMKYRLTNLLSTLGLLLIFSILSTDVKAQFVPTGPDSLFVGASCLAALDVGSGPTFTTDSVGFTFEFDETATGYDIGDSIPAGVVVDVTYVVTYPFGTMDIFSYPVISVDIIPPTFDNIPNDTILTCLEMIPIPPVVTASDDCDMSVEVVLSQTTTQTADGSCNDTQYNITRTWTATDDSGNMTTDSQSISITNDAKPSYMTPRDTMISCEFREPMFAGNVAITDVISCGTPTITYVDVETPLDADCPQNILIERTWTVSDGCSDSTSVQMITAIDTIPPTFMPTSGDTTISCDFGLNIDILGKPLMLEDNCADLEDISVTKTDFQMGNICASSYFFERRWYISDACGNTDSIVMMINVVDTLAPIVMTAAQDANITCTTNPEINVAFADWINTNGSAVATDNCSSNLLWNAFNSGTSDLANLPAAVCPSIENGVYRKQTVDFVVSDECGNRDTTTAVFTVTDTDMPMLSGCPTDTTLFTEGTLCNADFTLLPPVISEGCGSSIDGESHQTGVFILGQAGPPIDTPVESITVSFGVSPPPVIASDSAIFVILLDNIDGEDPTEYFNILDENDVIVGQTSLTTGQCGVSITNLKFAPSQVNAWANDGIITFTLSPNIPAGLPGRFSINPICQGSSFAFFNLDYPTTVPNGLLFEYTINGGARINTGNISSVNENFDLGVNEVKYYVSDCAGNQDSCSFNIIVEDNIPPSFDCSTDVTFSPDMGECSIDFSLPFPQNIVDNCTVGNTQTLTAPDNMTDALLTFVDDPNLNDYLAEDKTFTFTGTGGNVISDVEITVAIQADASGTGAFYTIFDENNNQLGTVAGIDCDTINEITFTASAQDYNTWANDGIVNFTAVSNVDIPIPPGGTGDGINPCDAAAVQMNGDNDGISFMTISITFTDVSPAYYAEGATTIATTQFQAPNYMPVETLNAGETEFFYFIVDASGNADTCSYIVNVLDNEMPTALCAPSFVTLNPSGAVTDTIFPVEIDFGSFDNCGIDTMFVTPNILTCNSDTLTVTLTVVDEAGNQGTCQTLVGVTTENPQPTYTVDCTNNVLNLFANPPVAIGGISFTYEWSGPNNFVSFIENPTIQDADGTDAGFYSVEITGVTNCTAEEVVEVLQSELPPATPDFFIVQDEVCSTDNIVMTASNPAGNGQVSYVWYMEDQGGDVILETTTSPFYSIPAPATSGSYCYYVITTRNNCFSQRSLTICVQVTQAPTAMLANDNITVCEGEDVILEAVLPLPGPGVNFEFIGPGGSQDNTNFQFEINDPTVNDSGTYLLTAYKNGCQSNTVMASIFVNEVPDQPEITSNGPICFGETLKLLTNVQQAATYIWTSPNFTEFSTNENTLELPNATNTYNGNWRVRVVTEQNCTSVNSAFTSVVVNTLPVVAASIDNAPTCDNEDILLSANQIVDAIYEWSGPASFAAGTRVTSAPSVAGTYSVSVTDQNGCSATDDIVATLQDAPSIIGVAASDNDCPTGPEDVVLKALLSDNTQDYDFAWSGNGFNSTDSCAIISNATMANNGSYQVIVTGPNGCADTSAVQVTMGEIINTPEAPVSTVGNMLCAGDALTLTTAADFPSTDVTWYWITPTGTIPTSTSTLIINPTSAANTGEYSVYAEVGNCFSDTSGVLLLTVSPAPVTTATCLNCPVCEGDDIMLSADCSIPGATYEWTSDTGFNSTLCAPTIPNAAVDLHEGTYSVRVKVNECWSQSATVFVTVNERPNNPQAFENGPYCVSSSPINLNVTTSTATPGATYNWYLIENGGSTEIGSTVSTSFNVPDSQDYIDGMYNFYVVAEMDGCLSLQSTEITVSVSTIPNNQAYAGEDLLVCEEDEINLSGDTPSTGAGLWTAISSNTAGATITNPDEATTSVSGLIPGNVYNYSWALSNGACVDYSIDTTTITVSLVELADAGELIEACSVTEINLNGVQPNFGLGTWTQPNVQELLGVTIQEPNNPQTLVTDLVPGNTYIFTWIIPDNGCGDDSDDVLVQVANDISNAGQDVDACGFGCATLAATSPQIGSGEWFSSDPAITFAAPNSPTSEVCGLSDGDNTLIWILNNGSCGEAGIDTIIVSYLTAPTAEGDIYTIPFAGVEELTVLENDDFTGIISTDILQTPEHGTLEEVSDGIYSYTADINFVGTDVFTYELCLQNCECTEAIVNLSVGGEATCDIPTIITPNSDGINDAFVVPCLAELDKFPSNNVSIFNQWGDEVFRASPYQNDWSGTYNGQDLPVGTYFFVIDFGNNDKPKNGFLLINR